MLAFVDLQVKLIIHVSLPAELVGLSLVQKAPLSDDNTEYITFVVHDIVLDYLQQHIDQQKQVKFLVLFNSTE